MQLTRNNFDIVDCRKHTLKQFYNKFYQTINLLMLIPCLVCLLKVVPQWVFWHENMCGVCISYEWQRVTAMFLILASAIFAKCQNLKWKWKNDVFLGVKNYQTEFTFLRAAGLSLRRSTRRQHGITHACHHWQQQK